MAIEQRANDTPTQYSWKCFILRQWLPLRNNFFPVGKTANMQTLRVCRPAAETSEIGGERFLDTFRLYSRNGGLLNCTLYLVLCALFFLAEMSIYACRAWLASEQRSKHKVQSTKHKVQSTKTTAQASSFNSGPLP